MLSILTLIAVAVVSLLITRIATLALVLTGMSREAARFQARSALSGTGFTTSESESVVGHPVRRRITMTLMLVGGAGIVTTAATLIIGFASASRGEAYLRLAILLVAITLLLLVARSQWFDRAITPLLTRLLRRYTEIDEARDYAQLFHIGGEWGVAEVAVGPSSWLADKRLDELDLRAEGLAVLGIERADGTYMGAPQFDTVVLTGDTILVYGRREQLKDVEGRPAGPVGDAAHREAVEATDELDERERAKDAEKVEEAIEEG